MDHPEVLTGLLRRRGLKVTPQRQRILEILHANPDIHPSANTVYAAVRAQMPTISLKTVYETLHALTALGQLQRIDLGTGSARFDLEGRDHHHLVCLCCGRVQDAKVDESHLVEVARQQGFILQHVDIHMHGLCPACQSNNP